MPNKTVSKVIWYKRVQCSEKLSLETMLKKAITDRPNPKFRSLKTGEDAAPLHLINRTETAHGLLCGQFLGYTPGNLQPVIDMSEDATSFSVATMVAAAPSPSVQREFLEGISYFGVVDNHLLVVQSPSLRFKEFERYLNWLLRDETKQMKQTSFLTLSDAPKPSVEQKAAGRIKRVTFGTPALAPVAANENSPGDNELSHTYELNDPGFSVLKSVFGGVFDDLDLNDAVGNDKIRVKLTVYVDRKRSIGKQGADLLDAIGTAARHFDPEDVELELFGGSRIKGDELKIRTPVQVKLLTDGGLLAESDLYFEMSKTMKMWAQDGFL